MRDGLRMLALAWLLYFGFAFTVASLFPIIGEVRQDLGLTYGEVGIVLGAWQLVYLGAAVPVGVLVDRFPYRYILFGGTLVVATSQIARSYADGFLGLVLAVALLGIGGPVMSVGLPKVIAETFEGSRRAAASGVYVTGAHLGQMTALALTAALAIDVFASWRTTLRLYGLVVLVIAVVWLVLADRDIGSGRGQGRVPVLRAMAHVARVEGLWPVVAIGCAGFLASHGFRSWLPEVVAAKGFDPVTAGLLAALPALCGMAGSILLVRRAARHGRARYAKVLLVMIAGAVLVTAFGTGPVLVLALAVEGFCAAALMPLMLNVLMELPGIGPQFMGAAAGIYFSVGEIGGFGGPSVVGVLVSASGSFVPGLCVLAVVMCLMLIPASRLAPDGAAPRDT